MDTLKGIQCAIGIFPIPSQEKHMHGLPKFTLTIT